MRDPELGLYPSTPEEIEKDEREQQRYAELPKLTVEEHARQYREWKSTTHYFEGGKWHLKTLGLSRWIPFLAFFSFVSAFATWILPSGDDFSRGSYSDVAPFLYAGLFFSFLTGLQWMPLFFPTQKTMDAGLVVTSILSLILIWGGWFWVLANLNTPIEIPAPQEPLVLNQIDKFIYEHNLTVPEDERVPLVGNPSPEPKKLLPFLDYNVLKWAYPKADVLTTPDGEDIEAHLFETEEDAAAFYGLWLPFAFGLCFFPAMYLSVPYINKIAESVTKFRYLLYGGILVALVSVLSLGFVPEKVDAFQATIFTSMLGFSAIGLYMLLHCSIDNRTFWIAAHVWGAVSILFVGYLMVRIDLWTGMGIPFLFAGGLLILMWLRLSLSPSAYQRMQPVLSFLGHCVRLAPLAFIGWLLIRSWFIGPTEQHHPVDQWITVPKETAE